MFLCVVWFAETKNLNVDPGGKNKEKVERCKQLTCKSERTIHFPCDPFGEKLYSDQASSEYSDLSVVFKQLAT